ncbi:MAG: site-specific integrase [Candidatus Aminicenantes bacterium]|nr:site-specific integrase [Candidatus Aminicenantes bacterium]
MKYREPRIRKRGKRWQIDFINPEGKRRQLTGGYTREIAERLRIKFASWLIDGKDPEIELQKERKEQDLQMTTLRELFPVFMDRHGSNRSRKMQESYQNSFGNVCRCPQLADVPSATINQAVVLDYMNARIRLEGVKPATVNREKAFISVMLSKAMAWGYLKRHPLEGMENFREPKKRDVELTAQQAAKLIEALPTRDVKNIVAFAIYSGLRLEAILDLRIEDIVFYESGSTSTATIRDKGGEKTERLLSRYATEILKSSVGERAAGHVFLNPWTGERYRNRMSSFDKAVRKLGLTAKDGSKLRFHDLRHVYGNWLHQAGVSLDDLRVLYGHRDRATTDRYITPNLKVVGEKLALQPRIPKEERKPPRF